MCAQNILASRPILAAHDEQTIRALPLQLCGDQGQLLATAVAVHGEEVFGELKMALGVKNWQQQLLYTGKKFLEN